MAFSGADKLKRTLRVARRKMIRDRSKRRRERRAVLREVNKILRPDPIEIIVVLDD